MHSAGLVPGPFEGPESYRRQFVYYKLDLPSSAMTVRRSETDHNGPKRTGKVEARMKAPLDTGAGQRCAYPHHPNFAYSARTTSRIQHKRTMLPNKRSDLCFWHGFFKSFAEYTKLLAEYTNFAEYT